MQGVDLSLEKAAQFFGVDTRTVHKWLKQGLPGEKDGKNRWVINSAAASKWLRDRERESVLGDVAKVDEQEARRRKLVAEAAREEHKLAIEQGTVVSIAVYEASMAAIIGAARAKLLNMPQKLGPLVATLTALEARDLIQAEINEVLQELSGFDADAAIAEVAGQSTSGESEVGEDMVATARSDYF
jgi:phage terminase Nu1 subunit (DNA packaging protein)